MRATLTGTPPPLGGRWNDMPDALRAHTLRMLALDPEDRFRDGAAVLDALRETKEPGLTDRLIALDYAHRRATVLTLDRKIATLPGCARL